MPTWATMNIILNKTTKHLFLATLCLIFSLGIISADIQADFDELKTVRKFTRASFPFKELSEIEAMSDEDFYAYRSEVFAYLKHQTEIFVMVGLNIVFDEMDITNPVSFMLPSHEYFLLADDREDIHTALESFQATMNTRSEDIQREELFKIQKKVEAFDKKLKDFLTPVLFPFIKFS